MREGPCWSSMRSSVSHWVLLCLLNRHRLHRMMMASRNPQHAPQHGSRHGQPAGYQHHNGHGQAHWCLLFALHRAPAFRNSLYFSDSLVNGVFQAIDQRSLVTNQFALCNRRVCGLRLYRGRVRLYDRWRCRNTMTGVWKRVIDGAGIFSSARSVACRRLRGGAERMCRQCSA